MITPKKIFVFISFSSILFFSCGEKYYAEEFFLYPGLELNDTTWNTSPIPAVKTDSIIKDFAMTVTTQNFSASSGGNFIVGSNAKITLPVDAYLQFPSLTPLANTATIKAEVFAMYKKGDFIRNLRGTNGNTSIGETDAMFSVKLSNNNGNVVLKSDSFLKIQYVQPTANSSYKYFYEIANSSNLNNPFYWVQGTSAEGRCWPSNAVNILGSSVVTGYEFTSNKTGFLSVTKGFSPSSTSRVNVVMPVNFTNKNTVVFAVFVNRNIVLRLMPDAVNRNFYFENMPDGEDVTFISVSNIDNKYYWGSALYTIYKGFSQYKLNPRFNPVSVNEILGLLNNL